MSHGNTALAAGDFRYDPFSSPQVDDPHPVWERARSEHPVHYSSRLNAWVLSRYESVRAALADADTFRNEGSTQPFKDRPAEVASVLAQGMPANELRSTVSLDGDEHRRIRKFLVSVLTPRRFGDLEESCRRTAVELIAQFQGLGKVDLVEHFAYRLPLAIIIQLIGADPADAARLHDWSSKKMALQWGDMDHEGHLEAARSYLEFQEYLHKIVVSRRQDPRDGDVVTDLLSLDADDRPLTDAEVVGILMGFVAAGHETTMNSIALAVFHCLAQPERWAELVENPAGIPAVVEESLRYDAPAQAIWRRTAREVEIEGQLIPGGARVLLVLGSANRDADAFGDADGFCPSRSRQPPHRAFGRGVHACVGAGLARLEVKVAIEELTRRIPDLRLQPGFSPEFLPNAVQRFMTKLCVEWPTGDQ